MRLYSRDDCEQSVGDRHRIMVQQLIRGAILEMNPTNLTSTVGCQLISNPYGRRPNEAAAGRCFISPVAVDGARG